VFGCGCRVLGGWYCLWCWTGHIVQRCVPRLRGLGVGVCWCGVGVSSAAVIRRSVSPAMAIIFKMPAVAISSTTSLQTKKRPGNGPVQLVPATAIHVQRRSRQSSDGIYCIRARQGDGRRSLFGTTVDGPGSSWPVMSQWSDHCDWFYCINSAGGSSDRNRQRPASPVFNMSIGHMNTAEDSSCGSPRWMPQRPLREPVRQSPQALVPSPDRANWYWLFRARISALTSVKVGDHLSSKTTHPAPDFRGFCPLPTTITASSFRKGAVFNSEYGVLFRRPWRSASKCLLSAARRRRVNLAWKACRRPWVTACTK